ncbi:LOW QUALITY PROTEIN: uncharacterized protein C8orf76-like [Bombina bombina]|uniref:uncharacterized protein C8orf76 n=1 Tax=Bombina bombina TaxID=8345 RepID=UPI00235ADC19|nr:uncharacterized protein C8orf76 [Bombina bombina]XP_053547646.1 LOW QUALITY PROTEIN: uncharacterized protein C8orf76-like [Bombina bombina]
MEFMGFEDSVFAEPRDRTKRCGQLYTVRQCEPKWFSKAVNSEDSVEIITAIKFRGDLAYRQQDFEKALQEYNSCFLLLPPSNAAMRRDVQESQARCLAHLGRYEEALELAEILKKGASNTDHLTCALNLQTTIYNRLGNLLQSISTLQQLVSLHPFNPWFWKQLAELYMRLFIATANISECRHDGNLSVTNTVVNENKSATDEEQIGEEQHRLHISDQGDHTCNCVDHTVQPRLNNRSEDMDKLFLLKHCSIREELQIYSCASFIRASLLLQLIQPQQVSFALESNLKSQEEIEEYLTHFGLNEENRTLMMEVMGEDLSSDRIREEGQVDTKTTLALTSFVIPSDTEFRNKWFKKINPLIQLL